MERKIKNLELKKSGKFCFYLCEFLSAMSQSNRVPNSIFFVSFLVFAVNIGSGLSGLGFRNSCLGVLLLVHVVLKPEMRNKLFTHQVAQGVFQLHGLDEEVMFGIEIGCALGALEVK